MGRHSSPANPVWRECGTCKGTGRSYYLNLNAGTCEVCNGKGGKNMSPNSRIHSACKGTGRDSGRGRMYNCEPCGGLGWIEP